MKGLRALPAGSFGALAVGLCVLSAVAAAARSAETYPVELFAALPRVTSLQMSPDGAHVAFMTAREGRKHIIVGRRKREDAGEKPLLIPPVEDADILWFRWANTERLLISFAFEETGRGVETTETRLFSFGIHDKEPRLLVRPESLRTSSGRVVLYTQIQDDVIDLIPDDPEHILISVDVDRDAGDEVIRANVASGSNRRVQGGRRGVQNWIVDEAGEQQWGKAMQDDVTDGAEWLVAQGIADPDRMCIMGASYGGYAALMGAVKTPDLFTCAISINGVTDLPNMVSQDRQYIGGRVWTKSIGASRRDLKEHSPTYQVDRIRIPVLLVQADDDARVPKDHAKKMARKLKKAKKDVTLVRLKDGGHSLDTEAARLGTLRAVEAFLAEHLGGG